MVSWQDAENALLEAFEQELGLPDRERALLASGNRSAWPQIIRSRREMDYADGEGFGSESIMPSPRLSRRAYNRLQRMLYAQGCAADAVREGDRALVGLVGMLKLRTGIERFGWSLVWRIVEREEARSGRRMTVTSDALRMRYERAVGRVAARMGAIGLGQGDA